MSDEFIVLLIATNVEKKPYPVYPLGAALIASVLEQNGISVCGLDLAFVDDSVDAVRKVIQDEKPDAIGLSIRAVDTTSSLDGESYLPPIRELVKNVRGETDVPIICGGSGYSLFPEVILRYLDADYGVVGEAERTVVSVVESLKNGRDPAELGGVLKQRNGQVVGGPNTPWVLLNEHWTVPNYEVFPLQPYLRAGGTASLQTKRGCPCKCCYCTYPSLEGKRLRLRCEADILREIERLVSRGVDYLVFVDNNFNMPCRHAFEICRRLGELDHGLGWTGFVTPKELDRALVAQMKEAGARSLEIGSEAGTASTLRGLGKGHTVNDVRAADAACVDAGLTLAHYFIFGGPGETPDTVEETLSLISQLNGPAIASPGVRIYPRTTLHRRALAEGQVQADDDLLEPRFYFSSGIDPLALIERLQGFAKDHSDFLISGSEINIDRPAIERLRRHGYRGPMWELLQH